MRLACSALLAIAPLLFFSPDVGGGSGASTAAPAPAPEPVAPPAAPVAPVAPAAAAPTPPPVAAGSPVAAVPVAVSPTARMTLTQRVMAAVSNREQLAGANLQFAEQVRTLTAERDDARTRLNAMTAERDRYKGTIDELERTVNTLNGDRRTVAEETVNTVASMGFPADRLPGASADATGAAPADSEFALLEAFKKETNPDKKATIHGQIKTLRAARNAAPPRRG